MGARGRRPAFLVERENIILMGMYNKKRNGWDQETAMDSVRLS
jgi:hypothetical protein